MKTIHISLGEQRTVARPDGSHFSNLTHHIRVTCVSTKEHVDGPPLSLESLVAEVGLRCFGIHDIYIYILDGNKCYS